MEEEEFGGIIPTTSKDLRACLVCALIKTYNQFEEDGCDNCRELGISSKLDWAEECISANFDGTISLMEPKNSWVARWQGLQSYKPGCYAISVSGLLPDHVREGLAERKVGYVDRDLSKVAK
eukprot:Opistho-2@68529